jgi:hypothetical protein
MFIGRLIPHYKLKESFSKEYRKILANAKGKKKCWQDLRLPLKMSFPPRIEYGINSSGNPEAFDITRLPSARE